MDGSFVEANASKESRIPREQLAEAAQVNQTLRQYLVELEEQNPVEEPVHEQEQVSTTDPDSTYATKGGTPARLGYYDNYLVDNPKLRDCGSASDGSTDESGDGGRTRHAHTFRAMARPSAGIGGGRRHLRQWRVSAMVNGAGITPYMRTRDSIHRKNSPLYGPERFTYLPESNSYLCPAGQPLNFVGLNVRNRTHAYIGNRKRCGACSQKAQCTRASTSISPSTCMSPLGNVPAS